ncbi:MAG: hypothetical protein AAFO06_16000 [Cyanobacteria bacterium J06597_16]
MAEYLCSCYPTFLTPNWHIDENWLSKTAQAGLSLSMSNHPHSPETKSAMPNILQCDRCRFFVDSPWMVCGVNPNGPTGSTCPDFQASSHRGSREAAPEFNRTLRNHTCPGKANPTKLRGR